MVKFSEFSVDKVSFLSLESTQKKKISQIKIPFNGDTCDKFMSWIFFFFLV